MECSPDSAPLLSTGASPGMDLPCEKGLKQGLLPHKPTSSHPCLVLVSGFLTSCFLESFKEVAAQRDDFSRGCCRRSCIFFFINLFIFYFWLHWVFVAAHGLSLVAVSGGYSSLRCAGFSLWWLLLFRSTGSWCAGFSSCGARA